MNGDIGAEISACIDACNRCHETCMQHVQGMMAEFEKSGAGLECLHSMLGAIAISRLTAKTLLTDFGVHQGAPRLCAAICRSCADTCRRAGDMDDCVRACTACADSCDVVAKRF